MSDDRQFEKWKDVWASFEPTTERGSESLALSRHHGLPAAVGNRIIATIAGGVVTFSAASRWPQSAAIIIAAGSALIGSLWFFRVPGDVERQSLLESVDADSNQFLKASLESLRQRRTRVLYGQGLALFLGVLMLVTTLVVEFDQSRGVAGIVAFGFIASMGVLLEIERRRLERILRVYVRLQAELFSEVMGLDLPQTPEQVRLWGGSRKKRRRPRTS